MQTLQIRLAPEQVKLIDRRIRQGGYQSRSEAIRDYIRRAEFWDSLSQFRQLTADAGYLEADLWQDNEKIRAALYKKMFSGAA